MQKNGSGARRRAGRTQHEEARGRLDSGCSRRAVEGGGGGSVAGQQRAAEDLVKRAACAGP